MIYISGCFSEEESDPGPVASGGPYNPKGDAVCTGCMMGLYRNASHVETALVTRQSLLHLKNDTKSQF